MGVIEAFARGWVNARDSQPTPSVAPDSTDTGTLAAELEDSQQLIVELTKTVEALKARVEVFADLLRHRGVRRLLLGLHPDNQPNMPDEARREFENAIKKVNAAYEMLKGDE